jgi:uncharacterized membrane protein
MKKFINAGNSKRMETLTDGIMAIAATLLVLEIKVPKLPENYTNAEMQHAFGEIVPSFIAFVFSFLNILIFWVNHDSIGKTLYYFDRRLSFLNIFFLLFISLIPFTTAFISEYPYSFEAISIYGTVLFLASFFGAWMYYHIAFNSEMMHDSVSFESRKKLWKQIRLGPISFFAAILLGGIHVAIPICIYILMPFFYMFMKNIDLVEGNKKDD